MTRREPFILEAGRSGRIRTCDPLVPNEVRYQTAPHSASASRRRYSRQNPGLQAPSSMQERSEKALCAAHAGCTSISMPVCSAAFRGPCLWARLLGRSQVVRQRILIPPFGGSNPPAPANKAALPEIRKCGRQKAVTAFSQFCGDSRVGAADEVFSKRILGTCLEVLQSQTKRRDFMKFNRAEAGFLK